MLGCRYKNNLRARTLRAFLPFVRNRTPGEDMDSVHNYLKQGVIFEGVSTDLMPPANGQQYINLDLNTSIFDNVTVNDDLQELWQKRFDSEQTSMPNHEDEFFDMISELTQGFIDRGILEQLPPSTQAKYIEILEKWSPLLIKAQFFG